jgi:predicted N-acetyltransferase YhbS
VREIAFGSPDHAASLLLREALLRRPLGLGLSPEDLRGEERQIHIAAFEGAAVVGTVLLKPLSASIVKLRQMAVAPQHRGTGLGRNLVRFAEDRARARGVRQIDMSARVAARGFYETLGYRASGEDFVEVTLPHVAMSKML